jgi:hypothetical protein
MIFSLLFLCLVMAAVVAVPLILLSGLLHLVFSIVLLPFRILGVLFRVVFGVLGAITGLVFGGLGLAVGVIAVVFGLVFLPLLPFVVVFALIALAVRAASRRPTAIRRIG